MNITTIIQARTGSTRLPGKVMYPLDGSPALEHVVRRVDTAKRVDDVVVATSTNSPDDVIATYAPEFRAEVVRGSEADVLGRFEVAVEKYEPEVIVRVTGDCPLIDPKVIDAVIDRLQRTQVDYATNIMYRTFHAGSTLRHSPPKRSMCFARKRLGHTTVNTLPRISGSTRKHSTLRTSRRKRSSPRRSYRIEPTSA